jgi:hypothetical protein
MENRVGRLHELLRTLERADTRVIALSVVDTVDFAVVRVIVSEPDRAREIFSLNSFTVIENDILGVVLPEDPQPFMGVFVPLVSAELNISYTYPLLYRYRGRPAIALYSDNIDLASQILREHGHTLISDQDVAEDEFF